jgi:hypothetical protein
VQLALQDIAAVCGPNVSGWWYRADWLKTYGVEKTGYNFCPDMPWVPFVPPPQGPGPNCCSGENCFENGADDG